MDPMRIRIAKQTSSVLPFSSSFFYDYLKCVDGNADFTLMTDVTLIPRASAAACSCSSRGEFHAKHVVKGLLDYFII